MTVLAGKVMTPGILALLALASALAGSGGTAGNPRTPVLVELFTSEGCSDCPPADAVLERLDAAGRGEGPHVIVLSEHVDYFDGPGWKDPYSSPAFTARQNTYAQKFHIESVYTPEMVVNGAAEFVGSDARKAGAKIADAAAQPAPVSVALFSVSPGTARVEVEKVPAGSISGAADVMVALASNEASSQVLGGENGGRKLHHVAVVRSMKSVGELRDGQYFSREVSLGKNPDNLRVVAWVQQRGQGRVLGAAELRTH